ncbi:unnamed protein product [Dibothriocephalus latus]|uniref:NADH dehydrogenase [ubiquinone] 1 alpha subcomplex subunit 9, mitochondrial n=1 Tax=Dibothriocephalus latus TaxID=60516 RepID=A0A3P7LXJ4_DIBLA|nr:unnamed protein product [Dibothriocephalus latus]
MAVRPLSSRGFASEPISLSNLKRGTGGRCSFNGIIATVFGASGYLGRHVVNQLGRMGAQVIVPYRGDPYFVRDLKVMGDLGQVLFCQVNVEGAARIARLSKEMGIERFVHVSALTQNPKPPKYVWRPSEFLRTKAVGEKEVRRERPDAIIFRPSDMWGNNDTFLCYYAARGKPIDPLCCAASNF